VKVIVLKIGLQVVNIELFVGITVDVEGKMCIVSLSYTLIDFAGWSL